MHAHHYRGVKSALDSEQVSYRHRAYFKFIPVINFNKNDERAPFCHLIELTYIAFIKNGIIKIEDYVSFISQSLAVYL